MNIGQLALLGLSVFICEMGGQSARLAYFPGLLEVSYQIRLVEVLWEVTSTMQM